MRAVAKGQAERWCSHPLSACFVDLLKPGRDGDLVTFHFHHAMFDQKCQGVLGFLGGLAGIKVLEAQVACCCSRGTRRAGRVAGAESACSYLSSARRDFASCRSLVSKPSVNQS
jgi:hypothetical protein